MSLGGHLVELRKRLMIAALAVVLGMVGAFLFTDAVIYLITEPIRAVAQSRGDNFAVLNFETITSGFDLRMRIAFAIGILASAPIWLWQIWAFIMPGLSRREIRYTIGFLSAAIPLFFAGCASGLAIVPHIVELMAQFVPEQGAQFYTASFYYDFVFKLLVVVGVAYVLPVFLVALNLAGIVSGRGILRGWRIAILIATLFSALATPAADVVSMLLLAGVLSTLFFAAAGLSLILDRRKAKALPVASGVPAVEA
ncbi:twin-arginine translocase subunit TatC [Microbacterium sp. P06]|uniref:twin-arginine translocase subunit TatC n=1 Tax=Microbacterium sp. P06 TaxID=3366949 RepID=UPI0037459538